MHTVVAVSTTPVMTSNIVHLFENHTVQLNILLSTVLYDAMQVNNSETLQSDITIAIENASVTVRYTLDDISEIETTIISISDFDSGSNSGDINEIDMEASVSFLSESQVDKWIVDADIIAKQFKHNLMTRWGVNNSENSSLIAQFYNLNVDQVSSNMSTTMYSNFTNEKRDVGSLSTKEFSYLVAIGIFNIMLIVSVIGYIHAKFITNNELFSLTRLVFATLYLMDVVTGILSYYL